MPIEVKVISVIDPHNVTRDVCVVDKQPFYRSTGTSKDHRFENIWLPFKGFGEDMHNATGMFHKPDVASEAHPKIKKYFQEKEIAKALKDNVGASAEDWGRFQNTKSLLVTCQLSRDQMTNQFSNVVNTVEDPALKMRYGAAMQSESIILSDDGPDKPTFVLNQANICELNRELERMGAELSEDMREGYDPKAIIDNPEYNPMQIDRNSDQSSDSSDSSNLGENSAPQKAGCCSWLTRLCCTPQKRRVDDTTLDAQKSPVSGGTVSSNADSLTKSPKK